MWTVHSRSLLELCSGSRFARLYLEHECEQVAHAPFGEQVVHAPFGEQVAHAQIPKLKKAQPRIVSI